jgi:hypothetical protein
MLQSVTRGRLDYSTFGSCAEDFIREEWVISALENELACGIMSTALQAGLKGFTLQDLFEARFPFVKSSRSSENAIETAKDLWKAAYGVDFDSEENKEKLASQHAENTLRSAEAVQSEVLRRAETLARKRALQEKLAAVTGRK